MTIRWASIVVVILCCSLAVAASRTETVSGLCTVTVSRT
jgi:hypothetical protein